MKSYIKNFKAVWISFVIIALIELYVFCLIGKEKIIQNSYIDSLFDNKFKKFDVGQKYIIKYKSELFTNSNAQFIQIGDSSGAYGVRPNIVKKYFDDNMDYINTNCCADIGWDGYFYTANHFLKNNKNAKYLILHITPYSLPMQYEKGFSRDLRDVFGDGTFTTSYFRFFNFIPSLSYRKGLLDLFYQNPKESRKEEYARVMKNLGISRDFEKYTGYNTNKLTKYMDFSRGWFPYDRKPGFDNIPVGYCGPDMIDYFYDTKNRPTLNRELSKIKKVADLYKVKMVIIFNPVACKMSNDIIPIVEDLKIFIKNNPDVYIPFEFITTLDKDRFSDQWHLSPESSIQHSHRIGKALRNLK